MSVPTWDPSSDRRSSVGTARKLVESLQHHGYARLNMQGGDLGHTGFSAFEELFDHARNITKEGEAVNEHASTDISGLTTSGGTFTVLSGVKEYAHFADGSMPEFASLPCSYLRRTAQVVLSQVDSAPPVAQTVERLQLYNYCAQTESMPCPAHVDSGLLTIIMSMGGAGLEVQDQLSSTWTSMDGPWHERQRLTSPIPVVLLVGHTLEAASGGLFKAALHRVTASNGPVGRTSVVFKLHASRDTTLPGGKSVGALLDAFERERRTVNPQPGNARPSSSSQAPTQIMLRGSSMSSASRPEFAAVFNCQDGFRFKLPIGMKVRGPAQYSQQHPVLLNAQFMLWVIMKAAAGVHVALPKEIRQLILDELKWEPTTMRQVTAALAEHVRNADGPDPHDPDDPGVTPEWIKITASGRVHSLTQANARVPFASLLNLDSARSIVGGLGFLIVPPQAAGQPMGEQPHINLKVVTQDGNEIYFKIREHTQLLHLMVAFVHRQGVSLTSVRFLFDGSKVNMEHTPHQLGMEDGDVMDVLVVMGGD